MTLALIFLALFIAVARAARVGPLTTLLVIDSYVGHEGLLEARLLGGLRADDIVEMHATGRPSMGADGKAVLKDWRGRFTGYELRD